MHKHQCTVLLLVATLLSGVQTAYGQSPTGTISGRVTSSDGLPLPGVLVSVTSESAPGTRTTVTSATGDYLFAMLPPGAYTLSFVLDGFQSLQRTQNVAGTNNVLLDVTMSPAGVAVAVNVVGARGALCPIPRKSRPTSNTT